MSDKQAKPNLVALRAARERAVALLQKSYADDLIDIDELEKRLEQAQQLETVSGLTSLTRDLEGPTGGALSAARAPESVVALVPLESVPASKTVLSIFSGVERKGGWLVPRESNVVALFGGTDLDFREAKLAPGQNKVKVFAMFGGVDIVVPPGLRVTVDGLAIMGGFDDEVQEVPEASDDEPSLHISGVAIMGGVSIDTRFPGESRREAKKRRKQERKALTAARRKQLEERARKRLGPGS